MVEKKIDAPEGVAIEVKNKVITVKGRKGEISRDFSGTSFNNVEIESDGKSLVVKTADDRRKNKAVTGTVIAHTANMFRGVQDGYKYTLKILYAHFPITVELKGSEIHIKNFLGEKGARIADVVGGAKVEIQKEDIIVTGLNLEYVSQTAANIEKACRLTKRDRRVFQDGIYISGKFLQTGEKI